MKNRSCKVAKNFVVILFATYGIKVGYFFGFSKIFYRRIVKQLIKIGLYEKDYYLLRYPESKGFVNDGALHFILIGDRQGLLPSPVFDPSYYRAQASHLPFSSSCNSILHYALIGRYFGKSPSPYFDLNYYLKANPDVADSG
ncbi:MAG: hypothetical protein ABL927_15090, partial [Bdellovibrionales bacterium]